MGGHIDGAQSKPYSLTSVSVLSDDYIWTADVLVGMTEAAPLGVFRANDQPQALFVRADGVLCHLVPDAGRSSARWSVNPVGNTWGVTQAVAGLQKDGSAHGFYTDSCSTYHIELKDAVWSGPTSLPHCAGLSATSNFLTGELVVYGTDGDGRLVLVRQEPGTGRWSAVSLEGISPGGAEPYLTLMNADCDWVMAMPGISDDGGALALFQGSATSVLSGPVNVAVPKTVSQVIAGQYRDNSAMFMFTDIDHNLYSNVSTTDHAERIPNVSVAYGAAVLDNDDNLHLFATDKDGLLSVLHQTGWDESAGPVWAPAIPLRRGVQRVFSDNDPLDTYAFFAVDFDDAIWYFEQELTSGLWSSFKSQIPGGPQSYRVAQYRTEASITDENNNPAAGLEVSVSTSTNSAILVGGVLTPVGPTMPVKLKTGMSGRITLSTIASDIGSPTLKFTASELPADICVNPAEAVHAYLTGSGTLNGGTSGQRPEFSGNTLKGASVNGDPLAPKTHEPDVGSKLADAAFSGIQQMFQVKTAGNTVVGRGEVATATAFALDLSDPSNPTYTAFSSQAEYLQYRNSAFSAPGTTGSLGSWWDDVGRFFGDVWEGIKNGVIQVTNWVVHVADAVADFAVKVYDEIHHLTNMAISKIEAVVSAVQSIFAWIGAEIENLIEWLKMQFDWDHISNTAHALEDGLSRAFDYVERVIETKGEPLVNGFFAKLGTEVASGFDSLISQFSSGQSFGSLAPGARRAQLETVVSSSQRLEAFGRSGISSHDLRSWSGDVQNNWLLEKLESFLGKESPWKTVDNLVQPMETLERAFTAVAEDFQKALDRFASFLRTALTDPKDFPALGIVEFLSAAKEIVLALLAFLDGIVESFMQVMAVAVKAAKSVIKAPLEIPFVSSLLKQVGKAFGIDVPERSVSGIFCFALAIPITVLYKLANGPDSQPFPKGKLPARSVLMKRSAPAEVLTEDDSGAEEGILFTAVGIAALWGLMDTALDSVPETESMVFKILDVVAPTLLQVFTWPGGIPFTEIPLDSNEDKASFANWIVGWAVVVLDIALLSAGAIKWAPKSTIARYSDPTGKVVLSALGGINFASGVVASSLGAGGGEIAANILGPLPVLTQFLRLKSVEEASDGVTLALKLVIDFFAGVGLAVSIAAS